MRVSRVASGALPNARRPPGSTLPPIAQTWAWIRRSPLELFETHRRRYGDVFRVEILGPRYRRDRGRWPLARRTVIVYSAPRDVHEIFARSGDALRAGEAQEFLEWFLGPRSLMVLDGAEHRDERRDLLSLFGTEQLARFEATMQRAAGRAVGRWTPGPRVDLRRLVDHVLDDVNFAVALGGDPDELVDVSELWRRARLSFTAPLLLLRLFRADLGTRSPGGCLAAVRVALRRVVERRMRAPRTPGAGCLLDALLLRPGTAADPDVELILDRLITILGGMDNASAAAAWAWIHLLRNPSALGRATDEVRECPGDAVPGSDSFLEAVGKETLRLHSPFPAVVRRVVEPMSIGGHDLVPDTFVAASMYLMHRRPDLFPEPEVFRPERFMDGVGPMTDYVPFGAGVRRCIGSALATRQMRVVLAEIVRRFDIERENIPDLRATQRNVTVFPASTARVTLRLRATAVQCG